MPGGPLRRTLGLPWTPGNAFGTIWGSSSLLRGSRAPKQAPNGVRKGSATRFVWLNADPHPSAPWGSLGGYGGGQNQTPLERQQVGRSRPEGLIGMSGNPLGRFGALRASKACALQKKQEKKCFKSITLSGKSCVDLDHERTRRKAAL